MGKKLNTRLIRKRKLSSGNAPLSMLTAYDYQTAQLLNSTNLDLILVGDSVGNVVLGYDTTVEVSLEEMITFGAAVKRGAPEKFVVVDLPFGTYATKETGIKNSVELFQKTRAQALKLEGASEVTLELVSMMTATGIPVMGHIGLTPQSVHEQGGYYTHGKSQSRGEQLTLEAKALQEAGCFAVVLECVDKELAASITKSLEIPTIGIGSGDQTDGQVLVINDLLMMGSETPPSFCRPIANLFSIKKDLIDEYLRKFECSNQDKELKPNVQ